MSLLCCTQLSLLITYANVPTVSAAKYNEQLQATSQGQFCLLSYSDAKKAKGYGLYLCTCELNEENQENKSEGIIHQHHVLALVNCPQVKHGNNHKELCAFIDTLSTFVLIVFTRIKLSRHQLQNQW